MTSDSKLTISVPEAGRKYLNVGRNCAYEAAKNGQIPTIRVGRLLRVPIKAIERLLDSAEAGEAA